MTKRTGPGFRRKTYRLTWDDEGSPWHGLEVSLGGMSVDDLAALATLSDMQDVDPSEITPEHVARLDALWDVLARGIKGWNLEDDEGNPIGTTREDIRGEELAMLLAIVDVWQTAAAGMAAPLGPNSSGGPPLAVASIPMEPSAESRAS